MTRLAEPMAPHKSFELVCLPDFYLFIDKLVSLLELIFDSVRFKFLIKTTPPLSFSPTSIAI